MSATSRKIVSLGALLRLRKAWARGGRRVVFTNGVFDILHPGHVELLEKAKRQGDMLVVGVNSDASARRLGKGPERPINKLEDRRQVLAALACVDAVASFSEDTPERLLSRLKPDVLVKGADYALSRIAGRRHARRVVRVPLKAGYSTTALVRRLKGGSDTSGEDATPPPAAALAGARKPLRRLKLPSAFLLLNGEVADAAAARRAAAGAAAVLCADGGLRHALRLGLKPRLVLGDMDSLPSPLPKAPGVTYLCDFGQERSDFEKALRFLAERGCAEVCVAGALGGRLDHELVNLAVAERYGERLAITLLGQGGWARLCGPGEHDFAFRPGAPVTLLAAARRAKVTASGLRYPLRAAELESGSRGLSNSAASGRVRVRVHSGRLWVISPGR